MKWLILLMVLVYMPVSAMQETDAPYIYYYSSTLSAVVVERADGTDSRTLGEGLTPEEIYIGGPGWSPDGQWFAWHGIRTDGRQHEPFTAPIAAAVRVDNQTRLKSLDWFADIQDIQWSPDSRYLFVRGRIGFRSEIRPTVFWLVDVEKDTVVANTTMFAYPPMDSTALEWQLDEESLTLYLTEEAFYTSNKISVTLYFDGRVDKTPISEELYDLKSVYEAPVPAYTLPLDSPSGRYTQDTRSLVFTDTETDSTFEMPSHSDAVGQSPIEIRWHPSEMWAILGYLCCHTDMYAVFNASVASVPNGVGRELSTCRFKEACIDWLPEQVDVNRLPEGQVTSVLPAPISYDYTVEYSYGIEYTIEHDPSSAALALVCNPEISQQSYILDTKTDEIIFTLPEQEECETHYPSVIGFALSHDKKIYALYSALYDAQTGEVVGRFNTYGWDFVFSEDDTQLSMRSHNASMVWDVQEILESSKRMKALAEKFDS